MPLLGLQTLHFLIKWLKPFCHYIKREWTNSPFFPRIHRIRLISLAAQKFVSDIANDALQHCKMKGTASGSSRSKTKVSGVCITHVRTCVSGYNCTGTLWHYGLFLPNFSLIWFSCLVHHEKQDKKYTLTMEDLTPALSEYGINVKKPYYFT